MPEWNLADGFRFAGVHCGVRAEGSRRDLALIVSDRPAAAAGAFTQNRVVAPPVQVCRSRLPMAAARGVVVCSGNANACTGERGLNDARRMTALTAEAVGCEAEQILVCSTGVIGRPLPMSRIEPGIHDAVRQLQQGPQALADAAHAILTTDTCVKVSTRRLTAGGHDLSITGFAKGAAMIGPNMATLLAFVLSDAPVAADHLAILAPRAADQTFNCISVEGHTSTNDSLLVLANGVGAPLTGDDLAAFDQAVIGVCAELARAIAADAEGASHLIQIRVTGLGSDVEARRVAKTVADSPLVKTAVFGADPNWGRIVSAAGYAGVPFAEADLSLWVGDLLLYQAGVPQPFDAASASAYLRNNREIRLHLAFTRGTGSCAFWTCDLGYEYVRLNAEYTT